MFVNIKVQRSVFSVYFKPLTVLPEGLLLQNWKDKAKICNRGLQGFKILHKYKPNYLNFCLNKKFITFSPSGWGINKIWVCGLP